MKYLFITMSLVFSLSPSVRVHMIQQQQWMRSVRLSPTRETSTSPWRPMANGTEPPTPWLFSLPVSLGPFSSFHQIRFFLNLILKYFLFMIFTVNSCVVLVAQQPQVLVRRMNRRTDMKKKKRRAISGRTQSKS